MDKKKLEFDINNCYLSQNCVKEWLPAIAFNRKDFKVKKGELIFKEGDDVKGIYFVNTGVVKVHKRWDDDKDLIIRFAKSGSILGHRGLGGNNEPYPVSATALENCIISFFDMDFFENTIKVNSGFTYKLLMFFAEELRESERKMRNLAHMPVKGRIAEALLLLDKQFGHDYNGVINIELSRQDLASFAGTTYETVFRVMNDLMGERLVSVTGKSIIITNYKGLSKLTQEAETKYFPISLAG
jgi:CRP-like cAMP-binding protein